MSRFLIINGHQPWPFSEGRLNASLTERARAHLSAQGHEVRVTTVAQGYDPETEIASHLWADTVIIQFPVNWMGAPWSLKKYMDEVYSLGMDGRLSHGDGRSHENPKDNYGLGGTLHGKTYMLSVTFNAPRAAFSDISQGFFQGRSVDDLLLPMHLNAKFFAMTPLPTFAAFDVIKNPEIGADFARFDRHLEKLFAAREAKDAAA